MSLVAGDVHQGTDCINKNIDKSRQYMGLNSQYELVVDGSKTNELEYIPIDYKNNTKKLKK